LGAAPSNIRALQYLPHISGEGRRNLTDLVATKKTNCSEKQTFVKCRT